jgi:hypothetical protein
MTRAAGPYRRLLSDLRVPLREGLLELFCLLREILDLVG